MEARAEALEDCHRSEVLAGDHFESAELSLLLLLDEVHQLGIQVPEVLVQDFGTSRHVLRNVDGMI